MQIFVRTLTAKIITLEVESSDTILDVKQKLAAKEGMTAEQIYFVCQGRRLENERTLADYDMIREGSTVVMYIPFRGG